MFNKVIADEIWTWVASLCRISADFTQTPHQKVAAEWAECKEKVKKNMSVGLRDLDIFCIIFLYIDPFFQDKRHIKSWTMTKKTPSCMINRQVFIDIADIPWFCWKTWNCTFGVFPRTTPKSGVFPWTTPKTGVFGIPGSHKPWLWTMTMSQRLCRLCQCMSMSLVFPQMVSYQWVVGPLVQAVVAIAIATGHGFSFHVVTFCCGSQDKNLFASFR